jgi:hypothetical protein
MMSDWASSPTEAAPACPTYAADMPGQRAGIGQNDKQRLPAGRVRRRDAPLASATRVKRRLVRTTSALDDMLAAD